MNVDRIADLIYEFWWVFLLIGGVILAGAIIYMMVIQWDVYVAPWLESKANNATKTLLNYDYRQLIDALPENCRCTCENESNNEIK